MKARILIIEDNDCKFFAAKQVLEAQLKMKLGIEKANSTDEVVAKTLDFKPNLIVYRPAGGVAELLEKMKKRHTNRRNSEIVLLYAEYLDERLGLHLAGILNPQEKRKSSIASAA